MVSPLHGPLSGKVAIVTGAGGGLGRAHAIELARQGAKVVVNDLGTSSRGEGADASSSTAVVDEIHSFGGEAIANSSDISDWDRAGDVIRAALDSWGDLHILVNNAGVQRRGLIRDMTKEDWDMVLAVHGTGHMAATHHACRYWADKATKSGDKVDGSMIHTGSRVALEGRAGAVNYSFAKGGIHTLSKVAATEMAEFGVRSNCIAPTARTRVTTFMFGETPQIEGFDEWDPANCSPFVAFLSSDAARSITGELFEVRGSEVWWVRQSAPERVIKTQGRWTYEALVDQSGQLLPPKQA